METIKTVGVKELKNQLSAYLREVKSGVNILITERGNVIAELRKPVGGLPLTRDETVLNQWVHEGRLKQPVSKKRDLYGSNINTLLIASNVFS